MKKRFFILITLLTIIFIYIFIYVYIASMSKLYDDQYIFKQKEYIYDNEIKITDVNLVISLFKFEKLQSCYNNKENNIINDSIIISLTDIKVCIFKAIGMEKSKEFAVNYLINNGFNNVLLQKIDDSYEYVSATCLEQDGCLYIPNIFLFKIIKPYVFRIFIKYKGSDFSGIQFSTPYK